ncbi:MAG: hypothetical protein WDM78_11040 [Puia sp.]
MKKAGDSVASAKLLKDAQQFADINETQRLRYQLLGRKKLSSGHRCFEVKYPETSGCCKLLDSLGEAYALSGDKKNAIINFKKSLSLNPPPLVKANSENI